MNIISLGGWMMWPLLLVSIMAAAIIVERLLLYSSLRFPSGSFAESLRPAVRGDRAPLAAELRRSPLLARFADAAEAGGPHAEAELRLEGNAVMARLDARLPMLSVLARLAPLMGLLGTVLGMISTFSEIAGAQAGVNMNQLAGGIWQALVTTAAGLVIAIPAHFFLHLFRTRADAVAAALSDAAQAVSGGSTGEGRA
ncbi:MAG: MotA/TolQ/ExbB proton channel family protein [Mailhella sp.]|nr:MotA/TolQ/ExbB proton channel family protein [Mailhella sp.]